MFKFIVLSAIISLISASPTYPLVGYGYGVPAATSYSSRVDYHTPVIAKTVVAAPVVPAHAYGVHYGGLDSSYGSVTYPYGSELYYGNGLGYRHYRYRSRLHYRK